MVIATFSISRGQTLNKKEAQQFLQKAWTYVCDKDSVSFAGLWSLNDSESKKQRRPHSVKEIYGDYGAMRQWLDTAITRKMKIDHVEVESKTLEGTDTKYWITAWFKYSAHYEKGFGFYVAYFNKKWVVRDNVSTSSAGGK